MKYKKIAIAFAIASLCFAMPTSAYAHKHRDFVGQDIDKCEKDIRDCFDGYDIVYKYETDHSKKHNEILSQKVGNGKCEVSINNTCHVGVHFDKHHVNNTNSFKLSKGAVKIDGKFDDWKKLPTSYEYHWNNSENCWGHGEWCDGVYYKTKRGTYNHHVRHGMQMVCDGEFVYVHIKFARIYHAGFWGKDYRFYVDKKMASFDLETASKQSIDNIRKLKPGTYEIKIRHRYAPKTYVESEGAMGYLTIYDGYKMSDLEIKVPLSAMKEQNKKVGLKNVGVVEFFVPKLMYRKICCVGTKTYPLVYLFVIAGGICFANFLQRRRSLRKQVALEVEDGGV